MSEKLRHFLKRQIEEAGPMDVGAFIGHVLCHPRYGYYTRQDPLGKMGDFTTSPEISQMFGELIGAWVADIWIQMGQPKSFVLLEGGPGRGTLMADILRGTKAVPGFHDALQIHFLENSPTLRALQKKAIAPFKARWHESLGSIPDDLPFIVVANELLDALPFRQIKMVDGAWMERVVGVEGGGEGFVFGLRAFPLILTEILPKEFSDAPEGSVFEFSLTRENFAQHICERVKKQTGAALFIDYGESQSVLGDSFRAIYQHAHVPVLEEVGSCDLSSNVDFESLRDVIVQEGVNVHGPVQQVQFLRQLGIEQRAEVLMDAAKDAKQKETIKKDLGRLVSTEEMGMGRLFKVIGVSSSGLQPVGFEG